MCRKYLRFWRLYFRSMLIPVHKKRLTLQLTMQERLSLIAVHETTTVLISRMTIVWLCYQLHTYEYNKYLSKGGGVRGGMNCQVFKQRHIFNYLSQTLKWLSPISTRLFCYITCTVKQRVSGYLDLNFHYWSPSWFKIRKITQP